MVGPSSGDRFSAVDFSPHELRAGLFGTGRPRDLSALRRALLVDEPGAPAARRQGWYQPRMSWQAAQQPLPPTPQEVLVNVPAAQRLCESYQRTLDTLAERGRRQRIGLASLLGILAAGGAVLLQQQRLTAAGVQLMIEVGAGMVVLGLGLLAALWARDARRLARRQSERLRRGLWHGATLSEDRIGWFLRLYSGENAFTACYRVWRKGGAQAATA